MLQISRILNQFRRLFSDEMSGNFKYTKSCKALTEDQRRFYEENGFIVIKNNVPHDLIDELCQHFVDLCDGKTKAFLPMHLCRDRSLKGKGYHGQYVVNKVQDFLHDSTFFKYASYPAVTDVVESIIGPDIVGVHSMLINKPPEAHPDLSRHPLHQDLHYFVFRPVDTIVGTWTAMEAVNENNGCLYVIPGSHRSGELYKHSYPQGLKNPIYHGVSGFDHLPKINVIMEKGDTIFFHPLLLHGSGQNNTKGFRKAISVHFTSSHSYFIDVIGTIQEESIREIETITRLPYTAFWGMKGRHIKGDKGSYPLIPKTRDVTLRDIMSKF